MSSCCAKSKVKSHKTVCLIKLLKRWLQRRFIRHVVENSAKAGTNKRSCLRGSGSLSMDAGGDVRLRRAVNMEGQVFLMQLFKDRGVSKEKRRPTV